MSGIFQARKSTKALATFSVIAFLGASGSIIYEREQTRANILEALGNEAPWAVGHLENAGRGWVPMPWQNVSSPLSYVIVAAKQARSEVEAVSPDVHLNAGHFAKQATKWSRLASLCAAVPDGTISLKDACSSIDSVQLPKNLIRIFETQLASSYYLTLEHDQALKVEPRRTVRTRVCNAAPYDIYSRANVETATRSLTDNYRLFLGQDVSQTVNGKPLHIKAGECELDIRRAHDGSGWAHVQSVPTNSEQAAWFQNELRIISPQRFASRIATQSTDAAPVEAIPNAIVATDNKAVIADPYYYAVPYIETKAAGVQPDFAKLYRALADVKQTAFIVSTKFAAYKNWQGRIPSFHLGGPLTDSNSALVPGIDVTSLPRTSVWGESVALPEKGRIIAVNGREIYGIPDLYQAISDHGFNMAAGVQKPIKLTMQVGMSKSEIAEHTGEVRLLFTPGAAQAFNTDVNGFSEGLKSGLTAGLPQIKCAGKAGVTAVFNQVNLMFGNEDSIEAVEDYGICTWRSYEQAAYAIQFDTDSYRAAELLSMMIPMSRLAGIGKTIAGTRAVRGANAARIGTILIDGAVEGLIDGAFSIGMQPPSTPFHNRLYEAPAAAGFGFATSVAIDIILR
jgi:hypothetical protein